MLTLVIGIVYSSHTTNTSFIFFSHWRHTGCSLLITYHVIKVLVCPVWWK